jgi:hypothetical protein
MAFEHITRHRDSFTATGAYEWTGTLLRTLAVYEFVKFDVKKVKECKRAFRVFTFGFTVFNLIAVMTVLLPMSLELAPDTIDDVPGAVSEELQPVEPIRNTQTRRDAENKNAAILHRLQQQQQNKRQSAQHYNATVSNSSEEIYESATQLPASATQTMNVTQVI